MDPQDTYQGKLAGIAAHHITLKDVYENAFYDPFSVLSGWTGADDSSVIDSMIADIRFTGSYFRKNDDSMDILVKTGPYKGRTVLDVMTGCNKSDLACFLEYIKARPLLYAGRSWKISEIFATWVSEGAPTVRPATLP
jgi:hypothetical protein